MFKVVKQVAPDRVGDQVSEKFTGYAADLPLLEGWSLTYHGKRGSARYLFAITRLRTRSEFRCFGTTWILEAIQRVGEVEILATSDSTSPFLMIVDVLHSELNAERRKLLKDFLRAFFPELRELSLAGRANLAQ